MYCVPGSASIGAMRAITLPGTTFGRPVTASYRLSSSLQKKYPKPAVWVISCLTVAWLAGARSRGVSPSNPSSTWISANSGQYVWTGASRSRVPFSICCSATVVATILVIDMMRNCVLVSTSPGSPTSRGPKPPS